MHVRQLQLRAFDASNFYCCAANRKLSIDRKRDFAGSVLQLQPGCLRQEGYNCSTATCTATSLIALEKKIFFWGIKRFRNLIGGYFYYVGPYISAQQFF